MIIQSTLDSILNLQIPYSPDALKLSLLYDLALSVWPGNTDPLENTLGIDIDFKKDILRWNLQQLLIVIISRSK